MIKSYIMLAKPGIIFGNLLCAAAGFGLASKGHFDGALFCSMLLGLLLVIASACVFNNYIDRDIDKKMQRTQKRPLVTGAISPKNALIFGTLLGLFGLGILAFFTNLLATLCAFIGALMYVLVYSVLKRKTSFATELGSIAGAIPPVVGYVSVTNQLDFPAVLLFLILVFWQMPHFFAIAISQMDDYKSASIPVLPLSRGIKNTKVQMLVYVVAFSLTLFCLPLFGITGNTFMIIAAILAAGWLFLSVQGFSCKNDKLWAKKMFRFSLIAITLFAVVLILI